MIPKWKSLGFKYSHSLVNGLKGLGLDLDVIEWDYESSELYKIFAPFLNIKKLIKCFKSYDIVHVQYIFGLFHLFFLPVVSAIKFLTKGKLVLTLHEHYYYKDMNPIFSKLGNLHRRLFCNFADMIIVHSNSEKQLLPSPNLRKKSVKIPLGVEYNENDLDQLEREENSILLAGRITRHKGQAIAINAMGKIAKVRPDVKLYIVGSDEHISGWIRDKSYLPKLKNLVHLKGLKNNVVFNNDFLNDDAFLGYFKKCTISVLPYPKETTSSGILADVFSNGIPTVMTDAPVFREHTKNKAVYFKEGDYDELADKVLNLLGNREKREEMSREFKKLSEEYSWENVAKKHFEVYTHALHK